MLAGRRSGRFAVGTVATFVVAMVVFLFVPKGGGSRAATKPAAREDTASLLLHVDSLHRAAAGTDSQFAAAVRASGDLAGASIGLTPLQRTKRDSLLFLATELDGLIAQTESAPTPASYRALVAAAALHGDTRTARLIDSLGALEKRGALTPSGATDPAVAEINARMDDVGLAIRAAAGHRRESLARSLSEFEIPPKGHTESVDTVALRAARDRARLAAVAGDSLLNAVRVRNGAAGRNAGAATEGQGRRVPTTAFLTVAMVLVLLAGFSSNLVKEVKRPTVATPNEAERFSGAPVRVAVRDTDREPHIGGIDPFRMLYLALTATGTRARTVVVTGGDRAVAATVAGRLALAAAADGRTTLVVDADAEGSSVAGYYGQRPEPGFSDFLAGVRSLRDITGPIRAGDGVSIDVIPGGALRTDEPGRPAGASARGEFERFRSEHDFSVVVAPSEPSLSLVRSLVEKPVVLLCVTVGRTEISQLQGDTARIRETGATLHGLAVWVAELPRLPSRSELMGRATATRERRPIPEGQ